MDFIIWTGDNARHDSDEEIPRTEEQVTDLNELVVRKFTEVFGKEDNINDTDPTNDFTIPIVPTFGNNDIMPHNIFTPGPNKWTRKYGHIWRNFIPEEQRHAFERGGWFSVEVIPNRLAVFSLNTLYFFDSNAAVDGCAARSEPGYEQTEWLRIQLQFLRERGMKAILMGHVAPARTESKQSWDETCWQKYALWMQQYRDVVVGSVYGHMNIDHFILQDFKDISRKALKRGANSVSRMIDDDELSVESAADYLTELRFDWSQIPNPPKESLAKSSSIMNFFDFTKDFIAGKKHKKSDEDKFLEKIGGEWGERYSLSLVSPSVVPNYFPTLRVMEYNISGLDITLSGGLKATNQLPKDEERCASPIEDNCQHDQSSSRENTISWFDMTKKHRKPKRPNFVMPKPPSKSTPPGPAYSPQTFSWLGYTQYYANLTRIHNDFLGDHDKIISDERWHNGKHSGKHPKEESKKHHEEFAYNVAYDTRNDSVFGLEDLTVRSYLDLAERIGQYKPAKGDRRLQCSNTLSELPSYGKKDVDENQASSSREAGRIAPQKNKKYRKHHGKKHKHRKAVNKVWFTFISRAFVGTKDEEDIHNQFGH